MTVWGWLLVTLVGGAPVSRLPELAELGGHLPDRATSALLEARGMPLEPVPPGKFWKARIARAGDSIWLRVDAELPSSTLEDVATVTLFFPQKGSTASGYSFRFGSDGRRSSTDDGVTPKSAELSVKTRATRGEHGFSVTAAFPPAALPRFPAQGNVNLELCVQLRGATNCDNGGRPSVSASLPAEALRQKLLATPPASILSLEARPSGWLGFGGSRSAEWVAGKEPLNAELLKALLAEPWVDPASARIALSERMQLPGGSPLVALLAGANPFTEEGHCDSGRRLQLVIYRLKGKTADRVLDWPVSSCALGRASSLQLDDEATLTVGYESGATVTFAWTQDHFERTQLGMR